MDLSTITALFDSLNDAEQLLLLDHLAERTQVCDELVEGIQKATFRHYASICRTTEEAEAFADHLIPQGNCSPKVWIEHASQRTCTLERAIGREPELPLEVDIALPAEAYVPARAA